MPSGGRTALVGRTGGPKRTDGRMDLQRTESDGTVGLTDGPRRTDGRPDGTVGRTGGPRRTDGRTYIGIGRDGRTALIGHGAQQDTALQGEGP